MFSNLVDVLSEVVIIVDCFVDIESGTRCRKPVDVFNHCAFGRGKDDSVAQVVSLSYESGKKGRRNRDIRVIGCAAEDVPVL